MVVGGLFAPAVSAVVFNVDSYLDGIDDDLVDIVCHTVADTCTLRAAVMQANITPGDSTIVLPAGTYSLTRLPVSPFGADNGDLNLTSPSGGSGTITLSGAGAATTIIDANFLDRVLSVHENRTATISGVTLRNGLLLSGSGGGVKNEGALTVSHCTISGNEAFYGGGIWQAPSGALTISHGAVSGNTGFIGGGIQNHGSLSVYRSVISGNSAPAGAGIYNSGTMELLESTLSGNHDAGDGGGLAHVAIAPAGTSSVTRCTISGNSAYVGGGIYAGPDAVDLYVANSTISGNSSVTDGGGVGNFGTTWTYNATIAFNVADSDADEDGGSGGGVYNAGFFYPRNTVIAGNTHSGTTDLDDCAGTIGVFGHGWFSSLSGCTPVQGVGTAEWDLIGSLAELGLLQFNGGPTRTHALQAGSPMIDSGFACNGTGDPPIDQRGGLRTPAGTCDPGAFEYDALPAGLLFADGFELGNLWAWR